MIGNVASGFAAGFAAGFGVGALVGLGGVVAVLYLVYRLFKVYVERG